MTEIEAYQEYIRCKHNAFCKAVIRYAAIGKIIRLRQKWEREISLDYLTNEKFVQFAEPEPDEEHPFIVCGQTVLLCNVTLAAALSTLPEQAQEEIFRYYFLHQPQRVIGAYFGQTRSTADAVLSHYAGYIRYFSKMNGQVNAEVEDYVKERLIACLLKFQFDYPPDEP